MTDGETLFLQTCSAEPTSLGSSWCNIVITGIYFCCVCLLCTGSISHMGMSMQGQPSDALQGRGLVTATALQPAADPHESHALQQQARPPIAAVLAGAAQSSSSASSGGMPCRALFANAAAAVTCAPCHVTQPPDHLRQQQLPCVVISDDEEEAVAGGSQAVAAHAKERAIAGSGSILSNAGKPGGKLSSPKRPMQQAEEEEKAGRRPGLGAGGIAKRAALTREGSQGGGPAGLRTQGQGTGNPHVANATADNAEYDAVDLTADD